jgi:Fic family protein
MSAQIQVKRKSYYEILKTTQKGSLDITEWLIWFLNCLERAFNGAEIILAAVFEKARFWKQHGVHPLNDRQRKILNLLLDDFEGKLTSSKWAKLGKCSQDNAFVTLEV